MSDNIITVNFNGPKRGVIDVEDLEYLVDDLAVSCDIGHVFLTTIHDMAGGVVEDAGLSHLDFHLMNIEEIENELLVPDMAQPTARLEALDEDTHYYLCISASFTEDIYSTDEFGEETIPCTLYAHLSRITADGSYGTFDPSEKKWNPLNTLEQFGISKDLIKMIFSAEKEDEWKSDIIIKYSDEYGPITNEKLEEILRKNSEITSLGKELTEFAEFFFLDNEKLCIEMYSHDGARVVFEDGYYILQASINGKVLKNVYRTKKAGEMAAVLNQIFNRASRDDVAVVVPLSKSAFAVIKENGDAMSYILYPRQNELTKSERKLFKDSIMAYLEGDAEHSDD